LSFFVLCTRCRLMSCFHDRTTHNIRSSRPKSSVRHSMRRHNQISIFKNDGVAHRLVVNHGIQHLGLCVVFTKTMQQYSYIFEFTS
jgi:hypothetical protein